MKGFLISLIAALLTLPAAAQVFTVQPEGVAAKYLQFTPTDVKLSGLPLTHRDRQELLRFLQAEQGFAMRPCRRHPHTPRQRNAQAQRIGLC